MRTPDGPHGLTADVHVTRPGHTLHVALSARPGEVVAVAGPNGAGKTTLLRALAGTVEAAGSVRVGDEDWSPLPSHRRRVGLVHQEHALFPHLTARQNVAFGPRARGVRRTTAEERAQDLLDRLDVGDLADRRPDQLSGGQSQRVALARALATESGAAAARRALRRAGRLRRPGPARAACGTPGGVLRGHPAGHARRDRRVHARRPAAGARRRVGRPSSARPTRWPPDRAARTRRAWSAATCCAAPRPAPTSGSPTASHS